jgi:hypothetical protein
MDGTTSLAARVATFLPSGCAVLAVGLSACLLLAEPAEAATSPGRHPVARLDGGAAVVPTDYADAAHWLNVAKGRRHPVDVFYVYPTAYSRRDAGEPIFSAVDDPGMMKAAQAAYKRQAWAFRTVADIYAPYYRQVDATYQLALPPDQQEANIEGPPAVDVMAAFRYYIQHFNHGRPFILAGHSQGSAVLRYLLASYMKTHPRVCERMVVAYVVGQSITRTYLSEDPHLRYARGAGDTGVIVSWSTEAPTTAAPNPVLLNGGIAMNPISWTRAETRAKARQNRGSIQIDLTTGTPVLTNKGQILRVKGLADARVDRKKGVVICSTVPPGQPPYFRPGGFPEGVLHSFDYQLYFFSIRANAALRTSRYLATHADR